jgi:hypothetical protein
MLKYLTAKNLLILAAVLIGLDIVFSLLTTCNEIGNYGAAKQSYEKECTALGGPLIRNALVFLVWIGHVLHDFDKEIVALFTAVLTLSTIALWWSTRRLWLAGERQIVFAEDAANAAIKSNEQTRELFTLDRRALLNLSEPSVFVRDDNEELLLAIVATNVGKTLASRVEIRATARRYGVRLTPIPDRVEAFCLSLTCASDQKRTQHLVIPGQPRQVFTSGDIPIETIFAKGRFIEVIFCATYQTEGIGRLLRIGGYMTFSDPGVSDPDEDGWCEAKILPHNFRVTFAD